MRFLQLFNRYCISIHALRGEGDDNVKSSNDKLYVISIHALRGEGDALTGSIQTRKYISIHALRGEGDIHEDKLIAFEDNFNPRPPWGGRRACPWTARTMPKFQSTPSVGRATWSALPSALMELLFQSTPSVGRATWIPGAPHRKVGISIHALRGEGDRRRLSLRQQGQNFNPRPPWGGRLRRDICAAS